MDVVLENYFEESHQDLIKKQAKEGAHSTQKSGPAGLDGGVGASSSSGAGMGAGQVVYHRSEMIINSILII
jgi:hypothetical protein